MLSVRHKRSLSRRTCASILEVHIGKCSKIWVFLGWADQRLPIQCQTGTGRSTANMHQMDKYAQFKRYAKLDWEPVQTPKRWSDVLSCSSASDESGGCILDPLQRIDWRLSKCCQNGVAVVHSGCHKSRHQTRRDIGTEDSTDGFKAAKMEETGTDDGADVMLHG